MGRRRHTRWGLLVFALVAGCATRVVPPMPGALAYPEFVYPAVPQSLYTADAVGDVDRGWRYLQNDDLGNAEREFVEASRRSPGLYPAGTGGAYVTLARRDYDRALGAFDTVLASAPAYAPALVGRGQALLALNRTGAALEAFEAALAADASLDLRSRIEVLRFRSLQEIIEEARAATAAGQTAEARAGYARALAVSPDSGVLYRELGLLERASGDPDAGLDHFRRAVELDPGDALSLIQIGDLLAERGDFEGAASAYRSAAAIEPSDELRARIEGAEADARDARLPSAFQAIAGLERVSRGDLAALLGVRLEDVLRDAPVRDMVVTDTQGHWAATWIAQVARRGVMDPFPNHTFQPDAPITRGDLAGAVRRVVAVAAANRPDLAALLAARPAIADMAPAHLSYPAASVAVASGVMPLLEDERFQVSAPVSGREAIAVVARVRVLALSSR
ncbi:MAG: tetratricopeptide repeat protein [Acidobacteria bacterium]|nr:tetratricopeptide repeat protein [Acidobacteriota bacterium]